MMGCVWEKWIAKLAKSIFSRWIMEDMEGGMLFLTFPFSGYSSLAHAVTKTEQQSLSLFFFKYSIANRIGSSGSKEVLKY